MLKEIFGISIMVLICHVLALKYYLYWNFDWFDIFMHFWGGFLIGLIFISLIQRILPIQQQTKDKSFFVNHYLLFVTTILVVLVIGLGWELWEIFVGFTDVVEDKGDTILDLIMDLIGGVFAVLYYYFKYSK